MKKQAETTNGTTIERMFSYIARRYDCTNHLVSLGLDQGWRRSLADAVKETQPGVIVDLATGSGDVIFELWKVMKNFSVQFTGVDFCRPMLDQAEKKCQHLKANKDITFIKGDCLALPFADESVDCVTIAFGLRNLEARDRGLHEMHRILRKPNGRLFIMEFTQPHYLMRPFYIFYLKHFIPLLAGLITQHASAYRYLASSITAFPDKEALKAEVKAVGFREVHYRSLGFSTVAIHEAVV